MAFTLHPKLAEDGVAFGSLALCRLLLMRRADFPWIILVPAVPGAREITDLSLTQRHTLMDEITAMSQAMQAAFQPHKLNVAALGNVVPQLHVHIIARFDNDAAWPQPVWCMQPGQPWSERLEAARLDALRTAMNPAGVSAHG
jgi:diadenosine tetraphosphate (Ap4A) HIT family hydrolase